MDVIEIIYFFNFVFAAIDPFIKGGLMKTVLCVLTVLASGAFAGASQPQDACADRLLTVARASFETESYAVAIPLTFRVCSRVNDNNCIKLDSLANVPATSMETYRFTYEANMGLADDTYEYSYVFSVNASCDLLEMKVSRLKNGMAMDAE